MKPVQISNEIVVGSTPRRKIRQRVRKACEPCRRRKVKCDSGDPCSLCVGYNYTCIYANGRVSTSGVRSPVPAVSQLQKRFSVDSSPHAITTTETELQKQLYVVEEDRQFSTTRASNTRFTRVDSAIAFPRSLGISLNADELPHLQPFAWNSGTRPEILNASSPRQNISRYITLPDLEALSISYFTSINSIFNILNQDEFSSRVSRSYTSQSMSTGLEAVLYGVLALGSLFSLDPSIHEAHFAEQARMLLDLTFAHSSVSLSLDSVIGWILRSIYLRSTTQQPHVSWVASSMAMHVAESIGLHQEMSEIKTTHQLSDEEIETRRRTFWVASCLNRLFSAQYGRTMITLQNITCRYPTGSIISNAEAVDEFVGLMWLLPDLCAATSAFDSSSIALLTNGMLRLGKVNISKPSLLLLRAEMMFCIYRKLRHIGITLSPPHAEALLFAIRSALEAANNLARESQPWWCIISVPFHSTCVLLALNTLSSLALLSNAMEILQNLSSIFNSHTSKEALRTARYLATVAEKKRRKELKFLQRSLHLNIDNELEISTIIHPSESEGILDLPAFEWPIDIDLGFGDFLNLNYVYEDTSISI